MYHRIAPKIKGLPTPTWNVPPEQFRAQMAGLLNLGYQPLPLKTVLKLHQEGKPVPEKSFVVTFDDIYENVYRNAWPILEVLQIPATMFLATAYLDQQTPFPFDDWYVSGQSHVPGSHWRPVRARQCEIMQESGLIELAAHTHTHEDFRGRPENLYQDLMICQNQLLEKFGIRNPTFAFPYGTRKTGFSGPVLAETAKRAGLACSLTTEEERVLPASDPFNWGRFTVDPFDTAFTLSAKLDGYFEIAKGTWRRFTHPLGLTSRHRQAE